MTVGSVLVMLRQQICHNFTAYTHHSHQQYRKKAPSLEKPLGLSDACDYKVTIATGVYVQLLHCRLSASHAK